MARVDIRAGLTGLHGKAPGMQKKKPPLTDWKPVSGGF